MHIDPIEQLRQHASLNPLSEGGLQEISRLGRIVAFPRGTNLLAQDQLERCTFYLLGGQLRVASVRNGGEVMVGSTSSSAALRKGRDLLLAEAITEVNLLCIETNILDVTLIWDQLIHAPASPRTSHTDASHKHRAPGTVSAHLLGGALAALTPDRIALLLERFEPVEALRGQAVVREGDPGDHYYVIDAGRCLVTRRIGETVSELAELRPGDGFGEEALLGDGLRNATVTMQSDGRLYRLARADFDALLKDPLLRELTLEQAMAKKESAIWIDVRFPSEYKRDKLPWAINVPLGEIRHTFSVLDRSGEYVIYCHNGRRSAAAAFLLAQSGFKAWVLHDGLESFAATAPTAHDGKEVK
ncbi:cyclic nucleotide-binding domain-containing protein [Lacisediminimonas profundi]|uniref:cyclic nucleotide-binding domain-containing protein n=1 Tax=Lacisediminimonas profundi TaxID=2603856 RepID=UPI00124AF64A|nr:cyclic nucleotide-binding domain-containing protein [Lacisediminimonas profundi]